MTGPRTSTVEWHCAELSLDFSTGEGEGTRHRLCELGAPARGLKRFCCCLRCCCCSTATNFAPIRPAVHFGGSIGAREEPIAPPAGSFQEITVSNAHESCPTSRTNFLPTFPERQLNAGKCSSRPQRYEGGESPRLRPPPLAASERRNFKADSAGVAISPPLHSRTRSPPLQSGPNVSFRSLAEGAPGRRGVAFAQLVRHSTLGHCVSWRPINSSITLRVQRLTRQQRAFVLVVPAFARPPSPSAGADSTCSLSLSLSPSRWPGFKLVTRTFVNLLLLSHGSRRLRESVCVPVRGD